MVLSTRFYVSLRILQAAVSVAARLRLLCFRPNPPYHRLNQSSQHECDIQLLKPLDRPSAFNMHLRISPRFEADNIWRRTGKNRKEAAANKHRGAKLFNNQQPHFFICSIVETDSSTGWDEAETNWCDRFFVENEPDRWTTEPLCWRKLCDYGHSYSILQMNNWWNSNTSACDAT